MRIESIVARNVAVPMSRPIVMGDLRYDAREYLIVEIRTDEGVVGQAFGMTRNGPIGEIIRLNLGPLLVGQDPLLIERIWERLYHTNLPISQRGLYLRAMSLVDLALWDLKGIVANQPVWKLLGGFRTRAPAIVAGGYPREGRTRDDLARELTGYRDRGITAVKLAAGSIQDDCDRLESAREALGPDIRLAFDVHWAWRSLEVVRPYLGRLERLGLAWLEDPFPADLSGTTARLRALTSIPLALGEDCITRWGYRDLLAQGHVDVLRIDATSMGGLSEAVRVCGQASALGIPVSPHIFPEIHVHLAAAFSIVDCVEFTDPEQEIDMSFRFLRRSVELSAGDVLAPETPGLGIEFDPKAVETYTTSRITVQ